MGARVTNRAESGLLDEAEQTIVMMAKSKDGYLKIDEIMDGTGIGEEDVELVLLKRLGGTRSGEYGEYYIVPKAKYDDV